MAGSAAVNSTGRAVILFGHGSRDPLWRKPMEAVAAHMLRQAPDVAVQCAYLELQAPDLMQAAADLVQQGVTRVAIVPMLLGAGRHVREDLPALVADLALRHPGVDWVLQPSIGEDDRVLVLLATVALESIQ